MPKGHSLSSHDLTSGPDKSPRGMSIVAFIMFGCLASHAPLVDARSPTLEWTRKPPLPARLRKCVAATPRLRAPSLRASSNIVLTVFSLRSRWRLGPRPRLSKFARVSRSPRTLAPSEGNTCRLKALNRLLDPRPFAPTWPGEASLQAPRGAFSFVRRPPYARRGQLGP